MPTGSLGRRRNWSIPHPATRQPCTCAAAGEVPPYHRLVLEAVFTGLLVLSSLAIGWFGLLVVYKLFAGQR